MIPRSPNGWQRLSTFGLCLAVSCALGTAQTVLGQENRSQQQDSRAGRTAQDRTVDVKSLPKVPASISSDEEQALQLVDEILREQNMALSGANFVYRAEGRRDPFQSLLKQRQHELAVPEQRPPGLPGFLINEVQVSAVAQYQGRWHALLIGLDRRSYFAQVGTELFDGRVVEINDREVVFEQEVEDLLGARSTRRVVKHLRGQDG